MSARLLLLCALGCSAPDGPPPDEGPDPAPIATPPPPEPSRPAPPRPAAPAPKPQAPAPVLEATPADALPEAPFTAWTTKAPLTLVGPGGVSVALLDRLGVRVDVVQVLDARVRVTCVGCRGAGRDLEGWLPQGVLRAAGHPGTSQDPLVAALRTRASWAGSRDPALPAGPLCGLIDQGFAWTGAAATWEADGGRLVLGYDEGHWTETSRQDPAPASPPRGCRTAGLRGPPSAPP